MPEVDAQRSIPAWAGETSIYAGTNRPCRVYPRVGGGNGMSARSSRPFPGLSPRGRGKPAGTPRRCRMIRSIPAWAGETSGAGTGLPDPEVYPRVGGGNAGRGDNPHRAAGLSPRGRGKPGPQIAKHRRRRSIPAWAGETGDRKALSIRQTVYPRVGGGNPPTATPRTARKGLSPRGRGKRPGQPLTGTPPRSIPAWAGETPRHRRIPAFRDGLSPRGRGKPWGLFPRV